MKPDAELILADLICTAAEAADRDAARVAIGLDSRVIGRVRAIRASEGSLEGWADGILRGAMIAAAAVVVMTAVAWFTTDLLSVEGDLAFSALTGSPSQLELFPSAW